MKEFLAAHRNKINGVLSCFDRFATAFRYPGTSGRLSPGEDAQSDLDVLAQLLDEADREVGIGR